MAELKQYSVNNDIDSKQCNLGQLHNEILNANCVNQFDGLRRDEDLIEILGESILNETLLDLTVKNHAPN